jgi:hypothetical protein
MKARVTPFRTHMGAILWRQPQSIVTHAVSAADVWPRRRSGIVSHPSRKRLTFPRYLGSGNRAKVCRERSCLMKGEDDEARGTV